MVGMHAAWPSHSTLLMTFDVIISVSPLFLHTDSLVMLPLLLGSYLEHTAYLKPINTHPTLGEGQNGKLYGSGPDPFPPPRNKGKGLATRDYLLSSANWHSISISLDLDLVYLLKSSLFSLLPHVPQVFPSSTLQQCSLAQPDPFLSEAFGKGSGCARLATMHVYRLKRVGTIVHPCHVHPCLRPITTTTSSSSVSSVTKTWTFIPTWKDFTSKAGMPFFLKAP